MRKAKTAKHFLFCIIATSLFVFLSAIQASANPSIDIDPFINGARNIYVFGMILFLEAGVICLATGVGTKKGIITVAIANIASAFIGLIIRVLCDIDTYSVGGSRYATTVLFYFPLAVITEWPFFYMMLWSESDKTALKKSFFATLYAQILSHIFLMIVIPAKIPRI